MGCTSSSLISAPKERTASARNAEDVSELTTKAFSGPRAAAADTFSAKTLTWKLNVKELNSNRTLNRLQTIMSTACTETGITKCRATLINSTHVWISTRTFAFSPALAVQAGPFQPNFDAFYKANDTEPIMMEDVRLNPVCANHPGVAGRPNMRFFYGGPMLSRGHLLGILYLWQSEVAPRLPLEKVNKLKVLANEAVETLQEDMFEALGATTPNGKTEIQLAALWLDVSTPRWQIVGANDNWVKLTGISIPDMAKYQGLLDIMAPVNEAALQKSIASSADRHFGHSVPVIMSPSSPDGSSLQFALAMTPWPAGQALPEGIASSENSNVVGGEIWHVEVHARIQAIETAYTSQKTSRSGSTLSTEFNGGDESSVQQLNWHTSSSNIGSGRSGGVSINNAFSSKSSSEKAFVGLSATLGPSGYTQGVSDLTTPPRLATLRLGDLLGKGSYGKVYFGLLKESPVAVKVMQAPPRSADLIWAAQYETMIASDLEHENIVQTIDWCEYDDSNMSTIWIVQELCDLGSLSVALEKGLLRKRDLKERHGPPNIVWFYETAIDIARGMAYLHLHDVVHGDLSSNNVMIISADNSRGFIAKINDFGLSRALGGGAAADVSTKTIGTVSHMSPELLLDGVNSRAGDVYSFGVLLWEMWKGMRAFNGCSQAQIIFALTCSPNGDGALKIPTDAPVAKLMEECLSSRESRPTFEDIVPRLEAMLKECIAVAAA